MDQLCTTLPTSEESAPTIAGGDRMACLEALVAGRMTPPYLGNAGQK